MRPKLESNYAVKSAGKLSDKIDLFLRREREGYSLERGLELERV
jgi:hypothetical protein